MARFKSRQLTLPEPPRWGGRREGAGRRPVSGRRRQVAHRARPEHAAAHPVHVTFRARHGISSLRGERAFGAVRGAIAAASSDRFRVVHFSVQHDHVHAVVEASGKVALSRGVSGLLIRAARAINRALGRRGGVWAGRYHARAVRTPRETRSAILYVLQNWRKHIRGARGVDGRSSGPWFDGWLRPQPQPPAPSPVARARTWLATLGWRLRGGGPLRPDEAPAAKSGRP